MKTLILAVGAALALSACSGEPDVAAPPDPAPVAQPAASGLTPDEQAMVAAVRAEDPIEASLRSDADIVSDGYMVCRSLRERGAYGSILDAYEVSIDNPLLREYFTVLIPMAVYDLCPEYSEDLAEAIQVMG